MISQEDNDILREFAEDDGPVFQALKRFLEGKIEEMESISNIDLNKNVGLQTCARRYAFDILKEMFAMLVPPERGESRKAVSYQ